MPVHNSIFGRQVRHPAPTKFCADVELPLAKRLKSQDSLDSEGGSIGQGSDGESSSDTSKLYVDEIPGSQDEEFSDNDGRPPTHHLTELENALPPVETDANAIAEYELMRAAKGEQDAKWVKGRSSIYVDAFNLALETVLADEAHLFDEAEMEVFNQWNQLEYEAQYLSVLHRL